MADDVIARYQSAVNALTITENYRSRFALELKRDKAQASLDGTVDAFLLEKGVKRTDQAVKDALLVMFADRDEKLLDWERALASNQAKVEIIKREIDLRIASPVPVSGQEYFGEF